MPEVAEAPDEQAQIRDFLEQQRLLEEERRQQQEAARLLAEQDALAAQQQIQDAPAGDFLPGDVQDPPIGDFIEPPPMPQEAPMPAAPAPSYSVDSQQYANEVARAQRGSGFINADIGPGGNVITPGYDPEKDPRAIVARREATNLQRNQYIDSLMKGGATYAEAMRAAMGRHPMAGDDALRQKVETLAAKTPQPQPNPVIKVAGGRTYRQNARGEWLPVEEPRRVPIQGGKVDPLVTRQAMDLSNAIQLEQKKLSDGTKPGLDSGGKQTQVPLTDADQEAIRAEIKRLQTDQANLYGPGGRLAPEFNANVDQPSYMRMKDAFNAPPPSQAQAAPPTTTPAQDEKVIVTKDGKRFRLPKSQLDEALKAGYKLGQ